MKNQTALITGASSGIGYEFCKLLAQSGHRLVLVARNQEQLQAVAQEMSQVHQIQTEVITADLSQPGAAQEVVKKVESLGWSIDVLINNAGFGLFGDFASSKWEKELSMIQLNIVALTELTKLLLPNMLKNKNGRILNVASTAAFQPGPLMAVYYATKAYVLFFSEALAEELESTGVSVTALCPGPTQSRFQKGAEMEKSKLIQGAIDSPANVAQKGYRALLRGQRVVVVGFKNRMLAQSIRLMPRSWATRAVYNAQKPISN